MEDKKNNGEKIKYCQNCGSPIDKEAVVCPKCGVMIKSITREKAEEEKRPSPMAIISLVAGIMSLPCGFLWGTGILFAIAAVVLGILDLKNINAGKSESIGKGFDIAGIVCGGVGILIFIGIIIAVVAGIALNY
jgi:predicted RNA-binding Zn-ribbon protein involved in translation (DUF1610 family)